MTGSSWPGHESSWVITGIWCSGTSASWCFRSNGLKKSGTVPRMLWPVHLALQQFRPLLQDKHTFVRTDNTAAFSYFNRQGGLLSLCMSQLAHHLLLWSQTWLKSLHTVNITGELNCCSIVTVHVPRLTID